MIVEKGVWHGSVVNGWPCAHWVDVSGAPELIDFELWPSSGVLSCCPSSIGTPQFRQLAAEATRLLRRQRTDILHCAVLDICDTPASLQRIHYCTVKKNDWHLDTSLVSRHESRGLLYCAVERSRNVVLAGFISTSIHEWASDVRMPPMRSEG